MRANRPQRNQTDIRDAVSSATGSAAIISGICVTLLGAVNGDAKMVFGGAAAAGLVAGLDYIADLPVTAEIIPEPVNELPDMLR